MRGSAAAFPALGVVVLAACSTHPAPAPRGGGATAPVPAAASALPAPAAASPLDRLAVELVKLVLATGERDPGYVDAYYGPPEWQQEVKAAPPELPAIRARAERLLAELDKLAAPAEELTAFRRRFLRRQTLALRGRLDMLAGKKLSFDEESRVLYDAVAPHFSEQHFQALVAEVAALVPGEGELHDRVDAYQQRFAIPRAKLDAVFAAAIDACRERTAAQIALPPGESFTVEYVTGKPWSGYNWYQGGYQSLIQVNTDLPIFIDRALGLACHEGYPGHHVFNALLEQHLVRGRGWVELAVYPLYSPPSLIAEGSANYGVELAFPGAERVAFEKERLFPLAGLDPAEADRYNQLLALKQKLSYAGNEAARRYLDGEITAEQAVDWLARYSLQSRERAQQRLKFIETYRAYVINYNLGEDLVRAHVEAKAGDDHAKRWRVFAELLAMPRLPSELAAR
jgi:hypothetical protein